MLLEQARLRAHFRAALAEVSTHDVSHLAAPERAMREQLLSELVRYARRGRFPKNRDFVKTTPYFVDADGTRCAVAHLVEATGERKLVERIAATNNNALVPELARDPALRAWLRAVGLSVAEAARIQPKYCPTDGDIGCFCGPVHNRVTPVVTGVLEATALGPPTTNSLVLTVDQIHGDAPGIVVGQRIGVGRYFAYDTPQSGDAFIIPIGQDTAGTSLYVHAFRVTDVVELACPVGATPMLSKADGIQAAFGTIDDCNHYLEALDENWEVTRCGASDTGEGDGCSATGAPTLFGALFAAALCCRARSR